MKSVQQIRELFLDFFRDRGHLVRPSAPLVLADDATSLFTSAGMQPYMAAYRGEEAPPAPRVASVQKCNRTTDLEGVGIHNRYATFFEMLGNFAFGDYFKEGAIDMAWELFNDVLQLDRERLWFTVYTDDDEAADLWHRRIGIPRERILRFGRSDNFWPKARWEGPCGPCSEIHIDLGEHLSCGRESCRVNCDCDRYLELWNLVFQMYTESESGELTPLPRPGVDTGMGLERLALVLQEKDYITETDELWQICQAVSGVVERQSGQRVHYGDNSEVDLALRIITDHLRAAAFIMADGVAPGTDGAGYVLRRFIRRAYRFGRQIGASGPFMGEVAGSVAQAMGAAYPELAEKQEFTAALLTREEQRFAETLEQGMNLFEEIVEGLEGETIDGSRAFTLYDTYGFPLELTSELAQERGLQVDEAGFKRALEEQRARSRSASGGGLAGAREVELGASLPTTEFVGYESLQATAQAVALVHEGVVVDRLEAGAEGGVVLDRTPFYAEKGGQSGDTGEIEFADGRFVVTQTVAVGDSTVHYGRLESGAAAPGEVTARVDEERRQAIQANHTATHLLHEALRQALGSHVDQSGSLVAADRLRFDFTHHESVDPATLAHIEDQVNRWIMQNRAVVADYQGFAEAKKAGARALFTEKYGDVVRTVQVAGVSMELCGGTHCSTTGAIGSLRIVSESSIAAGIRRIEAVTGLEAVRRGRHFENTLEGIAKTLHCGLDEVPQRVAGLQVRLTELQAELKQARQSRPAVSPDELAREAQTAGGVQVVARAVAGDGEMLMGLVDEVAAQLGDKSVVLLGAVDKGKVALVCKASEGAVQAGAHAGEVIREAATRCGGGGGGKPGFARAGGKDPASLPQALAAAAEVVARQVQA